MLPHSPPSGLGHRGRLVRRCGRGPAWVPCDMAGGCRASEEHPSPSSRQPGQDSRNFTWILFRCPASVLKPLRLLIPRATGCPPGTAVLNRTRPRCSALLCHPGPEWLALPAGFDPPAPALFPLWLPSPPWGSSLSTRLSQRLVLIPRAARCRAPLLLCTDRRRWAFLSAHCSTPVLRKGPDKSPEQFSS